MNEKWLIFIDVDGTLVSTTYNISENNKYHFKNKEVINKLIKEGHIVIPVTGRPFYLTKKIFKEFGFKQTINLSGADIFDSNIHFYTFMNKNKFYSLINDINEYIINMIIETKDKTNFFSTQETNWSKHIWKRKNLKKITKIEEISSIPIWIYAELDKNFLKNKLEILKKKYNEFFDFKIWWIDESLKIEIGQKQINKGKIIKLIMNKYSIPFKNTIAIGDGINDKEMLMNVNIRVAMKNAIDEIKKISTYITEKTNDEGGVGYWLESFLF